jgi:hypothetical protein
LYKKNSPDGTLDGESNDIFDMDGLSQGKNFWGKKISQ